VATLRFLDGTHAGQTFVLTEATETIGTAPDSSIRIRDPGVAPNHATIVMAEDEARWVEERQGPALVNGHGAKRTRLSDGDVLIFAVHAIARFEYREVVAGRDRHVDPREPGGA
jgi:pSer/pThr/pTyr-binding forkhead associated (FHA) protein